MYAQRHHASIAVRVLRERAAERKLTLCHPPQSGCKRRGEREKPGISKLIKLLFMLAGVF